MVHVQVREEDFVEVVQRNAEGVEPLQRAGAHVEDKLITIAQLDQEAGGSLFEPRHRHAGAEGDNPHLVGLKLLCSRIIDIMLWIGFGR